MINAYYTLNIKQQLKFSKTNNFIFHNSYFTMNNWNINVKSLLKEYLDWFEHLIFVL